MLHFILFVRATEEVRAKGHRDWKFRNAALENMFDKHNNRKQLKKIVVQSL